MQERLCPEDSSMSGFLAMFCTRRRSEGGVHVSVGRLVCAFQCVPVRSSAFQRVPAHSSAFSSSVLSISPKAGHRYFVAGVARWGLGNLGSLAEGWEVNFTVGSLEWLHVQTGGYGAHPGIIFDGRSLIIVSDEDEGKA